MTPQLPAESGGARLGPVTDDDELEGGLDELAPRPTAIDDIAGELTADLEDGATITLEIPGRPGWSVRFATIVDYQAELIPWRRKARDPAMAKATRNPDAVNEVKLAALVLAYKCQALIRRGEVVTDDAGTPWTFRSREFLDLMKAPSAVLAIKKLYRKDGNIAAAGNRVLEEAGYGSQATEVDDADVEDDDEDPTTRSTTGS